MSVFKSGSIRNITINGESYAIHDFILKQMNVFAPLFDESFDQQNINLVIKGYDNGAINDIFMLLYGTFCKKSLINPNIEQLKLMMYIGLDNEIITKVASDMGRNESVINIIMSEFVNGNYHDCMNIIIRNYDYHIITSDVINMHTKIKATSYPLSTKIKFLSELIKSAMMFYYCHKEKEISYRCDIYIDNYNSVTSNDNLNILGKHYNIQDQITDIENEIKLHMETIKIIFNEKMDRIIYSRNIHYEAKNIIANKIATILLE